MSLLLQIPHVSPEMLRADFWLDKVPRPDVPLVSPQAIADFNASVYTQLGLPDVFDLPDTVSAADVREWIARFEVPDGPRYGGDGRVLDAAYFDRLCANATPDSPEQVPVRFGLAVRRTSVRMFPTRDVANDEPYELKTDLFQETTIDIGWPVAVLATSRDARWYFCLTPLVWGWVACGDIAFAGRDEVYAYTHPGDWLVTLASQGLVGLASGGGVIPQMGTRLPLLETTDSVYRVRVPIASPDGVLCFVDGYANRQAGQFHQGDVPCTLRHLLNAAFGLLGERYAWGGSRLEIFGRDCSRFVKDVYATTGVILPRNSAQQGQVCTPRAIFSPDMPGDDRKVLVVDGASPGDLLIMRGHVMLYLGHIEGEPYVIHDVGGAYLQVLVSTLYLYEDAPRGSLLSRLLSAVSVVNN